MIRKETPKGKSIDCNMEIEEKFNQLKGNFPAPVTFPFKPDLVKFNYLIPLKNKIMALAFYLVKIAERKQLNSEMINDYLRKKLDGMKMEIMGRFRNNHYNWTIENITQAEVSLKCIHQELIKDLLYEIKECFEN